MDLTKQIEQLSVIDAAERHAAAAELFQLGRDAAVRSSQQWWNDSEIASLLGKEPRVTVGVAVTPKTFAKIRAANEMPRLATAPPDQDAQEFELHFSGNVSLDVLTTKEPAGDGAIAKYLRKFGEGVQQVEFLCLDVDRSTQILGEKFGIKAVYPATREGADGSLVNFFLVGSPGEAKVLIELYQPDRSRIY